MDSKATTASPYILLKSSGDLVQIEVGKPDVIEYNSIIAFKIAGNLGSTSLNAS